MSTSGQYSVYKVTNAVTDKFYIGITSHSVEKRWLEHTRQAKKKVNNGHFYRAIRKYGADSFYAELLFNEPTREAAIESEVLLILDLCPEYNSTVGGDGTHGHKVTPEGRKKMGDVNKGNKYNLGRVWTQEQREKLSKTKTGKSYKKTEKSDEARKNNIKIACKSLMKKVICLNDGLIYSSVQAAAYYYNISKTGVSGVCRGVRNSIYGLKFKFVEEE